MGSCLSLSTGEVCSVLGITCTVMLSTHEAATSGEGFLEPTRSAPCLSNLRPEIHPFAQELDLFLQFAVKPKTAYSRVHKQNFVHVRPGV